MHIKEVKEKAETYGVLFTDDQAEKLIADYEELRDELEEYDELDIYGSAVLIDAIIEKVMTGVPKNRDHGYIEWWHWPEDVSTKAYRDEFKQAFKNQAQAKGLSLCPNFWS